MIGEFLGYSPGRVFELSNGEKWQQEDHTDEPCWQDPPKAWLYWSQSLGSWHLDIKVTSATVRVAKDVRKRGSGRFDAKGLPLTRSR